MFQGRLDLGLHLRAGALVEVHDNGVLRRVVVIGCARRDPRLLGDFSHGGAVKPFVPEELQGGAQNPEAGLFGFGGHLSSRHRFEHVQDPV